NAARAGDDVDILEVPVDSADRVPSGRRHPRRYVAADLRGRADIEDAGMGSRGYERRLKATPMDRCLNLTAGNEKDTATSPQIESVLRQPDTLNPTLRSGINGTESRGRRE